jgi:hypothetical protein
MNSQEFTDTLHEPEPIGTEDDEEDISHDQEANPIIYDEIDSSKTMDEEIANFMVMDTVDEPSEEDEVCVGTDLSQFIGQEFSIPSATAAWMKWDVKRSLR